MSFMPGLGAQLGSMASAAVAATITVTDSPVSTADASTYTFLNAAIGTAATGRRVIVGAGHYSSGTADISSITIGGNASTNVISHSGGFARSVLNILQVDSGTTADIVVTWASGASRCGIAVWAANDLTSSTATDTGTAASADPLTDTINIDAGGVAIGYVVQATAGTYTWTNLTEDVDETIESSVSHSAASAAFAAAQTALSISCDPPSSNASMVLASFA